MNIIVCIKQVPDTAQAVKIAGDGVNHHSIDAALHELLAPAFWAEERVRAMCARIPQYRLSKFQDALPDAASPPPTFTCSATSPPGVRVRVPADVTERGTLTAPGKKLQEITRELPETRALLERVMVEVFEVARARGIGLPDDAVAATLAFVDSLPPHSTASMQRDIMAGRPSELEAQNGSVVRLGRAAGVATPINDCLYRCLLPQELRARGQLQFSV